MESDWSEGGMIGVRVIGVRVRVSGVRVSGVRVSGVRVSGVRVSGVSWNALVKNEMRVSICSDSRGWSQRKNSESNIRMREKRGM